MSTLKEIAQALNLSIMAVSKALRDAPDISVATKNRVLKEARTRNYVPNRVAQNLRSRRSGLVGVLLPSITYANYASFVSGIESQAEAAGLQILLAHSRDRAETEMLEVQKLLSRQVETLILVPAIRWQHRLATLELLRPSQTPTILLSSYPAGAENFPGVSWVVAQDHLGAEKVTEHLLQEGHREILFLAGPNGSSTSAGRFGGYQKALQKAGVAYSDHRVYLAAERTFDSGRHALSQALSEKASFTAVVAYNDQVAMGAIDLLQQQGFRVPEDISVVGFGDGAAAAHFRVPLTTIRVPHVEMGEASLRLALEIQQGLPVEPRQLPVDITIRQSTCALVAK